MIADDEIRSADPAAVIEQYEPFLIKLANRYDDILSRTGAVGFDDLLQVGRIAVLDAQKTYYPDKGSFINWISYYIRKAMRSALDFDNQTGAAPVPLVYLDEPLSDDTETKRGDMVADPDALPIDEPIIEDETKREISKQVREAVERMKSDRQREVITRVWLNGQERTAAAADMGMKTTALQTLDKTARTTLRRDWRLKRFVSQEVPLIFVSLARFNTTWTSATEEAAFWRLQHMQRPENDQSCDDIQNIENCRQDPEKRSEQKLELAINPNSTQSG